MTAAAFWWVNTATVKTYTGTGAYGAKLSPEVSVDCWIEDGSKMVLNSEGQEVVSTGAIHGPLDKAVLFKPGSMVDTGAGFRRVISVEQYDSGILELRVDHFVANLT